MSGFLEDPGQDVFEGLDLGILGVDEAYLRLTSNHPDALTLYTRNHDCHGCPLQQHTVKDSVVAVAAGGEANLTLHTAHPWTIVLSNENQSLIDASHTGVCRVESVQLGEFGVYDVVVDSDNCTFSVAKDPVFEFGALVIALCVYVGLALLYVLASYIYRKCAAAFLPSDVTEVDQVVLHMSGSGPGAPAPAKQAAKPRLKSLDTFRGLTIVLMIFVNYGAGNYWFLEHATWHGLQVADLVFPWFMWIMGVCIPMGQRLALRRNTPRRTIFWRIVKRSLRMFFLGFILNSVGGWVYLDRFRIPGVMQRYTVCYLVVGGIALATSPKESPLYQSNVGIAMSDVIQILPQWCIHLLLLAVHLLITFLLPVPGCPTGYQGPGGVALLNSDGDPQPQCIGGAAGEVDRWLFSSSHIYQNPTAKVVYTSTAFDPEGVLGTLTCIFQTFLGVQATMVLQAHSGHRGRVGRWLAWAALLGAVGAGLCGASMNDGVIPVNKNLWSLSFVLVTSCFAFFVLALYYVLIDVWGVWDGSPLHQVGMNGIFLYIGQSLAYNLFPWHYIIGTFNTHLEYLAECLWGTTLWVLIALYLYHNGIFYTI